MSQFDPDQPASGPPPSGPPPGSAPPPGSGSPPAPPAEGGGDGGGRNTGRIVVGVIGVIALVAAAFAVVTLLGDDEASADAVTLRAFAERGDDPFTASVAAEPTATLQDFADDGAPGGLVVDFADGPGGYRGADGDVPGLYGGTLNERTCDAEQLVEFLEAEPDKAEAWASVIEIDPDDIGDYVDRLTAINLGSDTRVVDHGFVDGEPESREVVLQRGNAVMVDAQGVPRVNCYSGNPLRDPQVDDDAEEEYEGDPWPSFDVTRVVIVEIVDEELESFEIVDVETGELFTRPAGTTGEADVGGEEPDEPDEPATTDQASDGPIEFDTLIEDRLEDGRNEARFTLDVPDGAVMTVTVENDRASQRGIRFIMSTPDQRFVDVSPAPGADEEAVVIIDHDGGQQFDIEVTGGPAAYSFMVALELQDDAGSGQDAGDELASSVPIETGSFSGLLGGIDGNDFFEVPVVPGAEFQIAVDSARESESRIRVLASLEGDTIFDQNVAPGADVEGATLLSGADEGSVVIEFRGGPGRYDAEVDFAPQSDTDADGDAGDELATAAEVSDPSSISGAIGQRDPNDFYVFDLSGSGGVMEFSSDAASEGRIRVILRDPSGRTVADTNVAAGATESADFEIDEAGQFRLEIRGGKATYSGSIT